MPFFLTITLPMWRSLCITALYRGVSVFNLIKSISVLLVTTLLFGCDNNYAHFSDPNSSDSSVSDTGSGGNIPLSTVTAASSLSTSEGQAPLTVLFDGSLSSATDHITDYTWDFGDDASSYLAQYGVRTGQPINTRQDYGRFVAHRFENPGDYLISLTVRGESGSTANTTQKVTVAAFSGTTYYVKNGGNDLADGLSDETAWASLQKVGSVITSGEVRAGNRVLFKRGDVFAGYMQLNDCAGTSAKPITFGAYGNGNRPELREQNANDAAIIYFTDMPMGSALVLENLYLHRTQWGGSAIISYCWKAPRFLNLTIRNCEIEGGYDGITYLHGASLTIENSSIHGAERQGLKSDVSNTVIRHALFHDNGTSSSFDHNIYLTATHHSIIEHSTLNSASGGGLTLHGTTSDLIIRLNDIFGNDVGISVTGGYAETECFANIRIDANRVHNNANMGLYLNSLVDSAITNNLISNNAAVNGNINISSGSTEDVFTLNTLLAHNVLYGTSNLLSIGLNQKGSSLRLENNILFQTAAFSPPFAITASNSTGFFTSEHNLFYKAGHELRFNLSGQSLTFGGWQSAGYDLSSGISDPMFSNAAIDDFHLLPSSSAVKAGAALWQVLRNFEDTLRGDKPNVGAY